MTKKTTRQYLKNWDWHVNRIVTSTEIDINEPLAAQKQRIAELEADPERWFKHYFPAYTTADPADFHKEATKRVLSNPDGQVAFFHP